MADELDVRSSPLAMSPLSPFAGAKPASPAWFGEALAREPERSMVPAAGADIELLTWGERGKPGLLLVHGNSAHADWWSFIAPFFADDFRIAAFSLSGMGGSDWRDAYGFEIFAEEMDACARAAGLYDSGAPPIYIGHSFGGALVYHATARYPDRMRAGVVIDTGFGGPPTAEEFARIDAARVAAGGAPSKWRDPRTTEPNRIYPTFAEALSRFRLMPPQVPGNLFIADHIARHSLKAVALPDGQEGWTWKFDPTLMAKIDPEQIFTPAGEPGPPLVHIVGDRSLLTSAEWMAARGKSDLAPKLRRIVIPDSAHHVMIDQPLALVAALRALLAVWPA